MLIVNAIDQGRGWSPIQHMVAIAGELFNCEVVPADIRKPSTTARISSVLRSRARKDSGPETCLIVCGSPSDLWYVFNIENWRKRFRFLAAWVIDSFWLDYVPRSMRLSNPFDHFFVTSLEDVDLWKATTGVSTTWLPWGSDALRLGCGGAERPWDLTRVGRQPPEWDNDHDAAVSAASLGMKYRGRPDSGTLDAQQNQRLMMSAYGATKFTLAFSNAVNRDSNNHPTREYLTGRWVDSLASGSVVAGVAPRGPNSDGLLWPGATLELGGIRRGEGLHAIAAALQRWTPAIAASNHQMALQRLDWRWRFKKLADIYQISSDSLTAELNLLEQRVARPMAAQISS